MVIWQIYCTNYTWKFVGWDYDPIKQIYEACFRFDQYLLPHEWFYQNPDGLTNIYWISIAAVYPTMPQYPWGWKTRPRDTNSLAPDDAVRIFDPVFPVIGSQYVAGDAIWWPDPTNSWDLAFELTTQSETAKWLQVPDLTPEGMDVHASDNPAAPPPYLLADDFLCTSQEPITNITIWGSWTNDVDWQNVYFTLSIHDDIPTNQSTTGYSMPGSNRWMRTFGPGMYRQSVYAQPIDEWWFTPTNTAKFPGDHICYQYDFNIPNLDAFYQEGDPANPKVYWLDVQALVVGAEPSVLFGWKTCPTNWNDDAVWVNAREPYNGVWNKLTYPLTHPRAGKTVDMAFRLNPRWEWLEQIKWSQRPKRYTPTNGFHGWNQYSVAYDQVVADDWVCTNTTPVTDIHWWGSHIGWTFPNLPETTGPTLPAGFNITIWTDVPQGPNNQFSHPGDMIWQIYCTNYAMEFVGWDFDPRNPGAPPEACFKYSQNLLEDEYFHQNPDGLTNIYWISIAAVYPTGQIIEYPWGWKSRLRDTNSLAPDDAVVSVAGVDPPWAPIEYPAGTSWDMAFSLTTAEELIATNDFGDAPQGTFVPLYPTTLANNGARHTVVPTVFMGNLIDAEADGQPNATATGDDLAGLPDEDGVSLTSLLIPGEAAAVNVTVSVPGFLSAWLDFNADGSWATPGDQIFNNVAVNAGGNPLSFNVPLTAARGTNTFARFRFSRANIASYTGQSPDGEVEDYRWYIEELDFGDAQDRPFPTLFANNGARHVIVQGVFMGLQIDSETDGQPNPTATGDDIANLADEDGVTLSTPLVAGQPATVTVVASLGGCFLNAWVDFGADGSWAQATDQIANNFPIAAPGPNAVNFNVPATAAVGSNVFARFRFSTMPNLTFTGLAPNGEVEDYLWKIRELDFGDAPDPAYPTFLANNGARHLPGNLFMGGPPDVEADGQPNAFATGDDLAGVDDEDGVVFTTALVSGVYATVQVTSSGAGVLHAWIDWDQDGSWGGANEYVIPGVTVVAGVNPITFQVPNGLSSGKTFARFRLWTNAVMSYTGYAANGEVEDYEVKLYPLKWLQVPEQDDKGVDVSLATPLADDFRCDQSGPITDVHIWGSFFRDVLPPEGPGSMTLTLTIYADVPVSATNDYSHPGRALWSRTFNPGQYQAANNYSTPEWWHDPVTGLWQPGADTNMYQFDFYIDPTNAFDQVEGTIYWLGVSNNAVGPANFSFGWKTTGPHWNDDACWQDAAGVWHDLHYGGLHPRTPESMDLAFAVSGPESIYDKDFGDAPNPYPTQWPFGAQHWKSPGFCLGLIEDTEANGIPHPQALGDDLNNQPDEDGVVFAPPVLAGNPACVNVTLTAPVSGLLDAWVDFNKNGVWDHPAEQIFASQLLLNGPNPGLCFNVPTNAVLGTNFARFRLSSVGGLSPTGLAPDFGEVEDYQVVILQRAPLTNIVITNIVVTNLVAGGSVSNVVLLQWNAQVGVQYQVQAIGALSNAPPFLWNDVGPIIMGPANTYVETNSVMLERYYRVMAPYTWP